MDRVATTHRVKSIRFELSLGSMEEAGDALSIFNREELEALLEEVFGAVDVEGWLVRIDRVELELGSQSLYSLKDALREGLLYRLKELIEEALLGVATTPHYLKGSQAVEAGALACREDKAELVPVGVGLLEGLEEFLLTGTLPWSVEESLFEDIDSLVERLATEHPAPLRRMLKRLAFHREATERLSMNLGPRGVARVVSVCSGLSMEEAEELTGALDRLYGLIQREGLLKEDGQASYGLPLKALIEAEGYTKDKLGWLWLEGLVEEGALQTEAGQKSLIRVLKVYKEHATREIEKMVLAFLKAYTENTSSDEAGKATEAYSREEAGTEGPVGAGIEEPELDVFKEYAPSYEEKAAQSEGLEQASVKEWFVANAGVVLLWPYLERYFERLGLLRDRRFVSEEKRVQAVAELEYLVRGDTDYREYHLLLNKILCGLRLNRPVEPGYRKEPIDTEQAEALLRHAIENWKKVGSLSVDGFRRAFLRREGKLSKTPAGWTLRIDRKGYDVLLDYLPYPIGVVKLPWMEEALYTEW